MSELIEVVQAVEATLRKPEQYGTVTFFGANDEWIFIESDSPNMCDDCASYGDNTYFGNEVRGLFPYLEIIDENTMYPKVHPSCGCSLVRVYPVSGEEEE